MTTLVAGAGGFIGGHVARALLDRGVAVRAVDRKPLAEWHQAHRAADNCVVDLAEGRGCHDAVDGCTRVFNFAVDMGGMGFIAAHNADCMLSVLINAHLIVAARDAGVERYFSRRRRASTPRRGSATRRRRRSVKATRIPPIPRMARAGRNSSPSACAGTSARTSASPRASPVSHNVHGPHGTWDGAPRVP